MHLIPLEHISDAPQRSSAAIDADDSGSLTTSDALALLADTKHSSVLRASEQIQQAVKQRIGSTLSAPHAHNAVATLPSGVAQALLGDPSLVSEAVAAFYERDALQLRKYAQWMKKFPPSPSTRAKVKLTRALYAQLRSQRFYPPRVFEKAGWRVETSGNDDASADEKAVDIGVKLAVGFEIRYGETASGKTDSESEEAFAYTRSPHYLRFIVALSKSNYFRGEIPGSKLYTVLEQKAAEYWKRTASDSDDDKFAARVDAAITAGKAMQQAGAPAVKELTADDDSWMYLDQEGLDRMLSDKTNSNKRPERTEEGLAQDHPPKIAEVTDDEDEDERLANEQAKRLQSMAEQFETFIEGEGAMDGALLDE